MPGHVCTILHSGTPYSIALITPLCYSIVSCYAIMLLHHATPLCYSIESILYSVQYSTRKDQGLSRALRASDKTLISPRFHRMSPQGPHDLPCTTSPGCGQRALSGLEAYSMTPTPGQLLGAVQARSTTPPLSQKLRASTYRDCSHMLLVFGSRSRLRETQLRIAASSWG